RAVGLLSALILALAPYAAELGQEAALYALAGLMATAALAAGWRLLRSGRGYLVYMPLGIVAIYSHYVVAVILLLFALLTLHPLAGPRRVSSARWIWVNSLILAAWLPWLALVVAHWLQSAVPRVSLGHTAEFSELTGALVQFT